MAAGTPCGSIDVEKAVRERYTESARTAAPALRCRISYDPKFLKAIPDEVIERDYGCGDPSPYVRAGDTVLDLGSGGGKLCFIAAQVVGPTGRVIGVDMNAEMLALARRSAPEVARRTGFANVEFRRGRIQDLALDMDLLDGWLRRHPVASAEGLSDLEDVQERLRRERPMISDASVDVVVSNCVLNLVRDADKSRLIREIYRVLKVGGRIAVSDIVAGEDVPPSLKEDPELWSGCVSGAFPEDRLRKELADAGFQGIRIAYAEGEPYRVLSGVTFRSATFTATKGAAAPVEPRAGCCGTS